MSKRTTLAALAYELSHEQLVAFTQRAAERGASAPTDDYLHENENRTFVVLPIVNTTEGDMLLGVIATKYAKLPERLTVEDFYLIDGHHRARARNEPGLLVFLEVPETVVESFAPLTIPIKAAKKIRRLGLEYLAEEVGRQYPEVAAQMRRMAKEL